MTAMMAKAEISQEIRAYYDAHADEVVPLPTVIHEIIKAHAPPNGADGGWWESVGYVGVWYLASGINRDIKAKEADPEAAQGELFPGYKRLQKRYSVVRAEVQCLVPVELLTDDELVEKIKEHRSMAAGHELHAGELQRFLDERNTH